MVEVEVTETFFILANLNDGLRPWCRGRGREHHRHAFGARTKTIKDHKVEHQTE